MLPRSFPCPFINASRFLATVSLSCAGAATLMAVNMQIRVAVSIERFVDDFIQPPFYIKFRLCPFGCPRITSVGSKATPRGASSPLRDRDFNVSPETGTLAHALVPSFEVLQRRSLDRKSMPAVYHGSQCDLGERQLRSR